MQAPLPHVGGRGGDLFRALDELQQRSSEEADCALQLRAELGREREARLAAEHRAAAASLGEAAALRERDAAAAYARQLTERLEARARAGLRAASANSDPPLPSQLAERELEALSEQLSALFADEGLAAPPPPAAAPAPADLQALAAELRAALPHS